MITGKVMSTGEIHLDGKVQGDIDCVSLILGENAQLEGSVVAKEVVIRGRLIGSVRARRVTLQPSSHVKGVLFHHSLEVDQGAYFDGKSCCSNESLSAQSTSEHQAIPETQLVLEAAEQRADNPSPTSPQSLPEPDKGSPSQS